MQKNSVKNGTEIQSQHWVRKRQLSMESIAVEYFPYSIDPSSNDFFYYIHI